MKYTKFKALNLGLERANNHRIERQQPEVLTENIYDDYASKVNTILEQHILKCKAVNNDKMLSDLGIKTEIQGHIQSALKSIDEVDPTPRLEKNTNDLETSIINRVAQTRMNAREKAGSTLLHQQKQMIDYLMQHSKQTKEDHLKFVKTAKGLSDEEKRFTDPVHTFYLQATASYDHSKEVFLSAIEQAPWPIQLVPDVIRAQGNDLLRQSIASDLVDHKAAAQTKLEMIDLIRRQAVSIAQNPTIHEPIQTKDERYSLTPDGAK